MDYDSGGDWEEETVDNSGGQKPYKILDEEAIKHLQESDISTVSGVLSVPRGVACSLLLRNNWNLPAAYDDWFSSAAADAALSPAANSAGSTKQLCNICYEKTRPRKMASAACGHLFCKTCWKTYIATSIRDGAACLNLRCPEPRCEAAVTVDMVEKFGSLSKIKRYHQHLRRSYVELSRNRKWCPAAGCDRAVEADGVGGETEDVVCDCSHKFCFSCAEEHHRPVACRVVAAWLEKNRSETENATWILAFTKPCPKCHRPIEKNQGCNHMTCKSPCRFEFCWICLAPWKNHGSGGYYKCNRYNGGGGGGGEGDESSMRRKAKSDLMRFTHFYERWEANDKSRRSAAADLTAARGRCGGGEMEFVTEAWEQIVECRRVLKWSYVYGYYLEEEGTKAAFFEYLQLEAEAALEWLHHCVEKEIRDEGVYVDQDEFREFRKKLVNLTAVTGNYFGNLVVGLENNLAEVGSSEMRRR